jgi:hypothetical protein
MQEGIINGVQFDFSLKNNDKKEDKANVNDTNRTNSNSNNTKKS